MIYFGDIHNHNELGYGTGSLRRSIEVARSHLDFFAFTGHSSWHDMPRMEGGRECVWIDGFAKLEAAWPDVVAATAAANADDEFVAILGFEWHSSAFGDQCVLFEGDTGVRYAPDHISDLRQFCLEHDALMLPHHLAYPTGHRGVNWDVFDAEVAPVVEIFSEHGSSEHDRGPYDFFNHAMGPRVSANTVRSALRRGLRFGFTASSDSHSGFPGGWDEGVTAIHADRLTRASVFEALRKRRTYALTGDRIKIDFDVDGEPMGGEVDGTGRFLASWRVQASDEIDSIDLIKNGEIEHRAWPESMSTEGSRSLIRVEWGWGPWAALDLDRVADWEFDLRLTNGRILDATPCLRSGPFDEDRRHSVELSGPDNVSVTSYSGRRGAYRGNPNHSIVLTIEESADARLTIDARRPGVRTEALPLDRLKRRGEALFMGPYPAECMLVHRLIPEGRANLSGTHAFAFDEGPSYVYLRVRQANGQMAWTSPVFLNG